MSTKVIPEKRIFVCDCCQRENQARKSNATLYLKADGCDWSGAAVGDASERWEFCDECLTAFKRALTIHIKAIEKLYIPPLP